MSKSPITCHGLYLELFVHHLSIIGLTHNAITSVLDSTNGKPASGVAVTLYMMQESNFKELSSG